MKDSATQQILRHLLSGKSITPIQALNRWQVFRLADVIYKLKKRGHDIGTDIVEDPKTGKHFARYSI